jgi:hypothetical protein
MNAKSAQLLMVNEVVMWDGNSKDTGTVRSNKLDVVTIDWQRYKAKKHKVDEMKLVEKWQPQEQVKL